MKFLQKIKHTCIPVYIPANLFYLAIHFTTNFLLLFVLMICLLIKFMIKLVSEHAGSPVALSNLASQYIQCPGIGNANAYIEQRTILALLLVALVRHKPLIMVVLDMGGCPLSPGRKMHPQSSLFQRKDH